MDDFSTRTDLKALTKITAVELCKLNAHIIEQLYDYIALVSLNSNEQAHQLARICEIEEEMLRVSEQLTTMSCSRCVSAIRVFCQVKYQHRILPSQFQNETPRTEN